ncbi:MAG: hypothetical protein ACYTFG_09170 [Planctomycetota bacterium]
MKVLSTVLWFGVLILLMHLLRDIYGPLLKRRIVKFAVAPGIIVFVFFKILACYVAGARIKEIKPFDDRSDLIQYEKPGLGALGEFLIGVLPLACLILAFALIFTLFPVRRLSVPDLPFFPLLWRAPKTFLECGWTFCDGFLAVCWKFIGQFSFWILVYAAVNTLLAGAPSLKDLKHVAIAAALGALIWFGIEALRIRFGSSEIRSFAERLALSFRFLLGAGVAWIIVSVVTVGVWRLFGKNKSERD